MTKAAGQEPDAVKARILLVDGDEQQLRLLSFMLVEAGYEVTTTRTTASALATVENETFDVTVLDPAMTDAAGAALLRAFCDSDAGAVIVVSAVDTPEAKIAALDGGAEDYLAKPFDLGELMARIRAALRRRRPRPPGARLELDLATRRFTVDGRKRSLSRNEADLLALLLAANGQPVPCEAICRRIWSAESEESMAKVRVLVWQVRRKIEPHPNAPEFLLAEPPRSYRLVLK